MNERVLITGGCGFIGSHLLDVLVSGGFECLTVDTLIHNNQSSIAHLGSRVKLNTTDIRDLPRMREIFASFRPQHVYHLAAHHFIPFCNSHPVEAITTNIEGTQNLASCCADFNVERLFFASTAAVYGPSRIPHSEAEPPDPIDIYGVTKAAGEKIVSFNARERMKVRIGRYFNAVGPRETNPHIIPEIVSQLRHSKDFMLRLGNLEPRRDYIHAHDIAEATVRVMQVETPGEIDIVNIGSGRSFSVHDLIGMFADAIGARIEVMHDPKRQRNSDRPELSADTDHLRSTYGFHTRVSLEEAVRELARDLRTPEKTQVLSRPARAEAASPCVNQ